MSDLNPYEEGLARDLAKAQARIEDLENERNRYARALHCVMRLHDVTIPMQTANAKGLNEYKARIKELKGRNDEYADKWED